MKTFADNAARTWAVTINVAAVRRVRDLLAVNLLELADPRSDLNHRMAVDPCLLCDILFCLVKPEADAKQVTDEDFGKALGGDALGNAADALYAEVVDFFPKGRREVLQKVQEKSTALQNKAIEMAMARLSNPKLETELDTALLRLMDGPSPMSNTSAVGNLPDSSESTPGSTPSGN